MGLRRIFPSLVACAAACGAVEGEPSPPRVDDRTERRAALEASLVSTDNEYARLRFARYATGAADGWDALPEWNPRVAPVEIGEFEAGVAPMRFRRPLLRS